MRIVFDHPGRQISSHVGRWVGRLAGSVLVFIGLAATVVAIPSGFVTIGDIINNLQSQPEELFEPGFPLRQIEAAFGASTLIAFVGLRYGRRLFRGHRTIVLFLRRFGYDGSMQVLTYAVANTIGVSWRLVTLDDDEIAPVGVDTTSRVVIGTGERLVTIVTTAGAWVFKGFQLAVSAMWAVVAVQILVAAPNFRRLLDDGTADRYAAIFASVMEKRIPVQYFDVTLSGAFALLMTAGAFGFVGLMILFVALLAMFPLFGVVILATSSADALRKAEQQKKVTISHANQVAGVAQELSRRGSQTFAPLLVVVRVATAFWQPAVSALASVASATIIDVSEPTDNLAWEVKELDRLGGHGRCIFIVDHARLTQDTALTADGATLTLETRLATLVDDREVLAYTTDRAGMRRFARALYGRLLDLPA